MLFTVMYSYVIVIVFTVIYSYVMYYYVLYKHSVSNYAFRGELISLEYLTNNICTTWLH